MEQLALSYPLAEKLPANLTYREIQQSLTLISLLQYFKDRGVQLPYHLELEENGGQDGQDDRRTSRP